MLVQLTSANFSPPASAYVTAKILTNLGATQDLTSVTLDKTWFTLSKITDASTVTPLDVTTVNVTDASSGIIQIIFNSTTTGKTSSAGDILSLYGGSVIGSLGPVIGTSTMDTGLGSISNAGQDVFLSAPTILRTADSTFNIRVTSATQDGSSITANLTNTDQAITISGVEVKSIKITPNNGLIFNNGDIIDFNIKYYDGTNGTGNILQFDGTSGDIIALSLIPT